MSDSAGPVSATTIPASCSAGTGRHTLRTTTSVDGESIAAASRALRASAADERRTRVAHAERVAEILARERAARLAPAETP